MLASKLLLEPEGIQILQVDKEVNFGRLLYYYPIPDRHEIMLSTRNPWIEIKGSTRSVFYCTNRNKIDQKQSFMDAAVVNEFLSRMKSEGKSALLIVRGAMPFTEARDGILRKVRVHRNNLGNVAETLLK